jgi:hypothetical protein
LVLSLLTTGNWQLLSQHFHPSPKPGERVGYPLYIIQSSV